MIYCGFFNSENKDRLYYAEDMNKPYELLVSNGVFATPKGTPSNYLQTYASNPNSMNVIVKAGRGIFFDKWFISDTDVVFTIDAAEPTLNRIDSIVARVDKTSAVRAGSIIVKKGTPNSNPTPPTIETGGAGVKEYRLANIYVGAGTVSISQSNITDQRGSADCGWVTSLIEQVDTSTLYIQWQTAFDDWFSSIKETLSTSTLIRSYNSVYKTTVQDETEIPINISQFNRNLDILQVYINGLMLIKDVEYTVVDNTKITLTAPVDKGTPISFVIYKSIDGSDAETVVQQVYELQNIVNASKITNDNGGVKLSVASGVSVLTTFANAGVGFHTMYSANGAIDVPKTGAYRLFGQMTEATYGWIIALQADGSVYSNYLNGGTWRGWKPLFEMSPTALYTGATFMNAAANIRPSKKLSECAHGWLLVWSDYDDATGTANQYDNVTTLVPKLNGVANDWNGSSLLCMLPTDVTEAGVATVCVKRIYIYDDHITGYAGNSTGAAARDVVLRAIYEY